LKVGNNLSGYNAIFSIAYVSLLLSAAMMLALNCQ